MNAAVHPAMHMTSPKELFDPNANSAEVKKSVTEHCNVSWHILDTDMHKLRWIIFLWCWWLFLKSFNYLKTVVLVPNTFTYIISISENTHFLFKLFLKYHTFCISTVLRINVLMHHIKYINSNTFTHWHVFIMINSLNALLPFTEMALVKLLFKFKVTVLSKVGTLIFQVYLLNSVCEPKRPQKFINY